MTASDRHFIQTDRELVISKLGQIWQEVLGQDSFTVDDNFFAIGGQSLSLLICASKITEIFKIQIDPMDLLEHQTLRELADRLMEILAVQGGDCSATEMEII